MKPPIERLLTDSPVLIFLCHEILPKTYVKSSHLMTYRNWKNSYKKYMISVIIKNNNKKMRENDLLWANSIFAVCVKGCFQRCFYINQKYFLKTRMAFCDFTYLTLYIAFKQFCELCHVYDIQLCVNIPHNCYKL